MKSVAEALQTGAQLLIAAMLFVIALGLIKISAQLDDLFSVQSDIALFQSRIVEETSGVHHMLGRAITPERYEEAK